MSDKFINEDKNLLNLDFLVISDTRLTRKDTDVDLKSRLSNWNIIGRFDSEDDRKHMGMVLLQSVHSSIGSEFSMKTYFKKVEGNNLVFAQVITLKLLKLSLQASFIYIRETPMLKDVERFSKYMQDSNIIMGDLNLDPNRDEDHKKLTILIGTSKKRVLHEVTTTRINQLDHILIDATMVNYFGTSYFNYTTDHKTITLRLPLEGNKLSKKFHQSYYFDNEKWTRKPKRIHVRERTHAEVSFTNLNNYLEILNTNNSKRQVFFIDFYKILSENGFKNIPSIYKDIKITNLEAVYAIIPNSDDDKIYGIVSWSDEKLELFHHENCNDLDTYQKGLTILKKLKNEYIDKLYKSFAKESPRLQFSVEVVSEGIKTETEIMVYMMTFLKCKVLRNIMPSPFDSQKGRENILSELKSQKLFPLRSAPRRRKPDQDDQPPKIPRISYRTFKNPNMESCWLNSCMQLILAALDHSQMDYAENASFLMRQLLKFQRQDFSMPQNPLPIRDLLLRAEISRICNEDVLPQNRLFQYAGTNSKSFNQLKSYSENQRIGQQDCKDFFICIAENKQSWMDVYDMFKFQTYHYSKCSNCGQEYQSENPTSQSFLMIDPPKTYVTMTQLIEANFQSPEIATDWRDELGCGKITDCLKKSKIYSLSENEFLTIVVNRLVVNGDGQLTINQKGIEVTSEITMESTDGTILTFEPIAIIHHSGQVLDNDTRGHFMADVLDAKNNMWIRTSDDDTPRVLSNPTDNGYIFLYKKSSD